MFSDRVSIGFVFFEETSLFVFCSVFQALDTFNTFQAFCLFKTFLLGLVKLVKGLHFFW